METAEHAEMLGSLPLEEPMRPLADKLKTRVTRAGLRPEGNDLWAVMIGDLQIGVFWRESKKAWQWLAYGQSATVPKRQFAILRIRETHTAWINGRFCAQSPVVVEDMCAACGRSFAEAGVPQEDQVEVEFFTSEPIPGRDGTRMRCGAGILNADGKTLQNPRVCKRVAAQIERHLCEVFPWASLVRQSEVLGAASAGACHVRHWRGELRQDRQEPDVIKQCKGE